MSMIPLTNDEKLLEAAAKAAGIDLRWLNGGPLGRGPMGPHVVSPFGNANYWNPLEDDGDALRLAFDCRLNSDFYSVGDTEGVAVGAWTGADIDAEFDGDGLAAWRRAIVRAAAALAGTTGESK